MSAHMKAYFDYKAGSVVGSAYNVSAGAATSSFAFMITSIFSKAKDVAHLLPSCKMSAQVLHGLFQKTVVGLEGIGFSVPAVITDNIAINRKAMSFFAKPAANLISFPHPIDPKRPLFFIYDAVHILKCVRNNWAELEIPREGPSLFSFYV